MSFFWPALAVPRVSRTKKPAGLECLLNSSLWAVSLMATTAGCVNRRSRDGIELLGNLIGLADDGHAVFSLNFVGYYRWGDENADAGLAESLHQSAIVKLPTIRGRSCRRSSHRINGPRTAASLPGNQQRGRIEDARPGLRQPRRESPFGKKGNAAVSKFMTVAFYIRPHGHRPVRKDHIQPLDRQFHCQTYELIFAADQADRLRQRCCRAQEPVGNGFWHGVISAHAELHRYTLGTAAQSFFQFVSNLKHLIGVGERKPAGFGQFKPASNPQKKDSATPSVSSSNEIWPLRVCGVRFRRSLARTMLPALATAQK